MANPESHIAFSDESYQSGSRYRSIAVVTLTAAQARAVTETLQVILQESDVREFKWERLRQARDRFAALRMMDMVLELSAQGKMRVDSLVWDTHDHRHKVSRRDDVANLQRMYYHLLRNVLQRRWSTDATWHLCPDENTALNWTAIQDYLDAAGIDMRVHCDLFAGEFGVRLKRDFRVVQVVEARSSNTPLCQLADLFAGLAAFSYSAYDKYADWLSVQAGQLRLDLGLGGAEFEPSKSDGERFLVMKYLNERCKKRRLGVGLASSRGFHTHDPNCPINFWLYESQHPDDRAPVEP